MQLSLFEQQETNLHKDVKECPKCQQVLHRSEFSPSAFDIEKRSSGRGGARWCRKCKSAYQKTLNGLKATHKYPQVEICDCCQKPPKYGKLLIDHCHITGAFRGWLCKSCNSGIGNLGDDIEGLERALAYLKGHYDGQP